MIALPKVVLLTLLIFVVWYGLRWFNRPPARAVRRRPTAAAPQPMVEDLTACRVCGAYVAASARHCGRAGCPRSV